MNQENLLTMDQIRTALADVLPLGPEGEKRPPSNRTINMWCEAKVSPMPFLTKPGTGKGTGKRTHKLFRLSDVLTWLEDPAGFWAARKHAS